MTELHEKRVSDSLLILYIRSSIIFKDRHQGDPRLRLRVDDPD